MAWTDIGEQEIADLLEVSEIEVQLDQGSTMTTIGRHPDLGAFTVVQTLGEFVLVTGADEGVMLEVLGDWGKRPELTFEARRLDRLVAKGEG